MSKIIKHGRETNFSTGTLLGLDFDGTMEVSNSFPLPAFSEEDDKAAKSVAQGAKNLILTHFVLNALVLSQLPTKSNQSLEGGTRR